MDLLYFSKIIELNSILDLKEFNEIKSLIDFKTNQIKVTLDFFRIN